MVNRLTFTYSITNTFQEPQLMLMPCVDGVPFTELLQAFELANGRKPAGGYSGLVPRVHCYGSIEGHFLGQSFSTEWNWGKTALLTCNCGVITCWSFMALIEESDGEIQPGVDLSSERAAEPESDIGIDEDLEDRGTVTWSAFEQPHRPEWNYSAFGPFVFSREPYLKTIRDAEARTLEDLERE